MGKKELGLKNNKTFLPLYLNSTNTKHVFTKIFLLTAMSTFICIQSVYKSYKQQGEQGSCSLHILIDLICQDYLLQSESRETRDRNEGKDRNTDGKKMKVKTSDVLTKRQMCCKHAKDSKCCSYWLKNEPNDHESFSPQASVFCCLLVNICCEHRKSCLQLAIKFLFSFSNGSSDVSGSFTLTRCKSQIAKPGGAAVSIQPRVIPKH